MEITTIRERRDAETRMPEELEVLVHNFYGEKVFLHFNCLGTCLIKEIGHRENSVMQISGVVLKALIEVGGAWLADIAAYEVEQRARRAAEDANAGPSDVEEVADIPF